MIGLEAFVPEPPRGPGRPPEDRRALARAFVAKAMLGVPTTNALIERLAADKSLRRIFGWERRSQVPSEVRFSRALAEFARGDLPDKMHAALIARTLGGRIVGVIARDATEIEAREKPAKGASFTILRSLISRIVILSISPPGEISTRDLQSFRSLYLRPSIAEIPSS